MNGRQMRQYESIRGCLAVVDHRDFNTPEIRSLRVSLQKAVGEIDKLIASQVLHDRTTRGVTATLQQLRQRVRALLMRISSRAIVELKGLPGIKEDVRMPRANARDADLLEGAARILTNLRPHLKSLYRAGLPRAAVSELEESAKALEARTTTTDTPIARRSRATASLPDAIKRAREIARSLDRAIKADLDGKAYRTWAVAYRVPGKKGRPKKPRSKPADLD